MIRGADTQFIFNLPCSCADVRRAKITFWQPENQGPSEFRPLPIVKKINPSSAMIATKQLQVILTKEETLRFSDKRKAYSQMVIVKNDGTCIPGKREIITVYPAKDELFDDLFDTSDNYVFLDGGDIMQSTGNNIIYMDSGAIETRKEDE